MLYGIINKEGYVLVIHEVPVKYFREAAEQIEERFLSSVSTQFRGKKTFKKLQTLLFNARNYWLIKEKRKTEDSVLYGKMVSENDPQVFPLWDLKEVFGKEDMI